MAHNTTVNPLNMINTLLYPNNVDNNFKHSDLPNLKIKDARLKGWETSNRDSLTVLNYTAKFVKTTKVLLNNITEIAFKLQVDLHILTS